MSTAARPNGTSKAESSIAPRADEPGLPDTTRRDSPPAAEIGVLLIAGAESDVPAFSDELSERLAPVHLVHANTVHDALARGLGGVDCIVLDVGSLDGYSDIDAVRHVRSGVSDYIPLVALLDSADEATGQAAMRFGAQAYLVKEELESGQLARTVRAIVRQQQIAMAEYELSLAHARAREAVRLERGLSPQPLLRDSSISVASVYRTGRSRALLGGDFIDLVQLDERRARLVVGDVCGHGPDEAAVGVSLRAAWRALAISAMPMVATLRTLESIFVQERHLPGLFVTMCMIDIDRSARSAEVLIAGHPQPLLIDGESVRPLGEGSGRAVGIGEGDWTSALVELPREWTVLAYTDGLIEGRTGDGPERLGEEGVRRVISEQVSLRPRWNTQARELLNGIVEATEELNRGPLSDDVAMLFVCEGGRC